MSAEALCWSAMSAIRWSIVQSVLDNVLGKRGQDNDSDFAFKLKEWERFQFY